MTDDTLPPPDDASDLFGYPPRRSVVCPGCGRRAEPFQRRFCWFCCHNGKALLIVKTTVNNRDRKEVLGLED